MQKYPAFRVQTRNFWQGEDVTKKFICSLVELAKNSEDTVFITSVFPKRIPFFKRLNESLKYRLLKKTDKNYIQRRAYGLDRPIIAKNVKNVWYTGENHRVPDGQGWDAFLSFEPNDSPKNNLHLPFWVTRLGETCDEAQSRIATMVKSRELSFYKSKFACAFIGNPEPTRLRFIEEFSKHFQIDLFGSVFNRPVKNKEEILKDYRFNICFENDLYPGYVTEKAIEAWECEAIPIWWGLDNFNYLNSAALIDVYSLGFEGAIQKVAEISNNLQEMQTISTKPILSKNFDIDLLTKNLKRLLS